MTPILFEYIPCNLCGADEPTPVYTIDLAERQLNTVWVDNILYHVEIEAHIVRCSRCGLMYVNPRLADAPDLHPYSEEMEDAYFAQTRPARSQAFAALVAQLPRWLGTQPRSLLDVGCGDGALLVEARKAGIQAVGTEVSSHLADMVRSQLGEEAILPPDLSTIPAQAFDVVALINVIEHVRDPAGLLQQIRRLLRPGGVVLIHTPNAGGLPARLAGERWSQIEPLGHFYYFDAGTLGQLMRRAELEPTGRFGLIVAGGFKGAVQRTLHRLGIYLDNGLGLVGRAM